MSEELWTRVDSYITELLVEQDTPLEEALDASRRAGLPGIAVSPPEGKLLYLVARAVHARSILEVGTLGGYSTIWLARALPADGTVVTLEIDPHHADVARQNFDRAGLADRIEVMVAPAAESLRRLAAERPRSFDLVFIDADKEGYPEYLRWSLELTRPGGFIVGDNVVRDGEVINERSSDSNVQPIRRFNELVATEPRLSSTIIQTVGSKGYDGFLIALVKD